MELKSFEIFRDLSDSALAKISKIVEEKKFQKGSIIFEEGTVSDVLYFIEKGKIEIFKRISDGATKTLAILTEGSQFGEMSLFEDKMRIAAARAISDTVLFAVKKEKFLEIVSKDPDTHIKVLTAITYATLSRLSTANTHLAALYDIGKIIVASKNLKQMISDVFNNIKNVFKKYNIAMIAVYNEFSDELDIHSSVGVETPVQSISKTDLLSKAVSEKKELLIYDVEEDFPSLAGHFALGKSAVISSLTFEDKFLGFILFSNNEKNAYTLNDMILLSSISSLVSVSVNNISFIAEEDARRRLKETRDAQGF